MERRCSARACTDWPARNAAARAEASQSGRQLQWHSSGPRKAIGYRGRPAGGTRAARGAGPSLVVDAECAGAVRARADSGVADTVTGAARWDGAQRRAARPPWRQREHPRWNSGTVQTSTLELRYRGHWLSTLELRCGAIIHTGT